MSELKIAPLILTVEQKNKIEADGVAEYPNECCGIIYGRDRAGQRIVQSLEKVLNAFEDGEQFHRFSITAKALMDAEKKCSEGLMVLGFYHSHPDHPARPSEYDRVHAWPFYSYVIVSIHQRKAVDLTCWVMNESDEQFAQQETQILLG